MSPIMVIALMNVAITSIFAITAIQFDKWWIILFSILVTVVPTKIREEKKEAQENENPGEQK